MAIANETTQPLNPETNQVVKTYPYDKAPPAPPLKQTGGWLGGPYSPAPAGFKMDPIITGALIQGGASLLGGMMGASGSKDMAKNQRRFITKQMQNAHQWEVEDLRKAGLNPILSAGGPGARGGTMASPTMPDVITPAVASAMAAKRLNQELKNMKAVENKDKNLAEVAKAQKSNTDADTKWKQFQSAVLALDIPRAQSDAKFFSKIDQLDVDPILKRFDIEASDAMRTAVRGMIKKVLKW